MNTQNFYISASIGASLAYIFNVLAFTGEFHAFRWAVFMAYFLIATYGFGKLIDWAEAREE